MMPLEEAEDVLKKTYLDIVEEQMDVKENPTESRVVKYEPIKQSGPFDAATSTGVYKDRTLRRLPKIGRNMPCPCGSGKKYKKCCINKEV